MRLWVDSSFLDHPARDVVVNFDGVLAWEDLDNENALPAFQSCWNQSVYCLIQESAQILWIIHKNVQSEFGGR